MSHHMKIARQLKERGYRLTPQRLAILEAIKGFAGHMTMQEVLDQVEDDYPTISLPTVYRNLQWLKAAGLVAESDLGGECHEFEYIAEHPHHHLVCVECGARIELPDEILDSLRGRLHDDHGFAPLLDHFVFFGVCAACQSLEH